MSNVIRFPGEKTRRSKELQADIDYETIFNLLSSISASFDKEAEEKADLEDRHSDSGEPLQTRTTEEISMDILDRFRRGREIMTGEHQNTPSSDTDPEKSDT